MKRNKIPKELFKLNIFTTIAIIIINSLIFAFLDGIKNNFGVLSLFANIIIFSVYIYYLSGLLEKKLTQLKNEVLHINYPIWILTFLCSLSFVLLASAIYLVSVNPDAANITFIFTFFMSTISKLVSSIILFLFIYFVVPTLIIPNIKFQRKRNNIKTIAIILFILVLLLMGYRIFNKISIMNNFAKQTKFPASRITVNYSTNFLHLNSSISPRAKQLMSKDVINIPFVYTSDSAAFINYEDGERFCKALNANVPNYLEAYHIVFNKFDTFGEKYYWTSDKDILGDKKIPLVLHFKNMSYEIIRKPENVKPEMYCVQPAKNKYNIGEQKYLYRNLDLENADAIKTMVSKPFKTDILEDINKIDIQNKQIIQQPEAEIEVNREKKHVNFSVKEVTPEYFNELINMGYVYNSRVSIPSSYEINDTVLSSRIQNTTNAIRLCYYPFMDYGDMNINQEKEIWKQSFCSPAFDIVNIQPALKNRYEKDSYCIAQGGRIPNIPELTGILKTYGLNQVNMKYWISTKVRDNSGNEVPAYVFYKDSRFMKIEASSKQDNAFTFCIKNPKIPSKVIANYSSRFPNTTGNIYAKQKCPTCQYYEVPDVVVKQQ